MANPEHTVTAFEAKTHLSRLLRDAEKGQASTITRRGKVVARIVPAGEADQRPSMDEILEGFARLRNSIKGKVNIRQLIEEGRKY